VLTAKLLLAAEEGGSHADENVLVPPIGELIIGTVAFGLLVAFYFWKVNPRVKQVYATRTEKIEGGLKRAEAAQAEAQALLEQYRAQLAEARTEANRIREDAHAQGRQIIDELRAQAQQEVDDIRARADAQLAADRAQVVAQLRREVGDLALDLAGRIVGQELSSSDTQRRLVDDFIAGLDAEPAGTATSSSGSGG
jgi:F-type H+-transporting ATPase subunit b